ncbi:uncharacterized protein LOC126844297 [Adelges cooleyi]|uniref:uncharacterized protein LOC126844297 n=1 Tax=Adelges cooleyi TaxID=133065 RepID=UPI00218072C0|nr:uncharacterized protein LOC126844297 [Adelges cooleyi]XP_050438345.1 uncharacterized protein LOC126844297 [Adelges cooleyi]XP_050438346.1 uncharacterized protein LOC126844297 [Adelges cooleyi]XP_050438347.1 uncharacterized protein LOC126844297 [Adelges cooleyi]
MSAYCTDDSSSDSDTRGSQETFFCTYCQDEISKFPSRAESGYDSMTIVVRCATCEDFYLCLMCFSSGAEIGHHKNFHDYKLVSFSKPNLYPEKLLNAIEEWVSEDTDRLLGVNKKLIAGWKDVANSVGSKNPEDVKREYTNTYIDGPMGQRIINLVNQRIGYTPLVSLDQAIAMGCFKNIPSYFPSKKILKIPDNEDNLEQYTIIDEDEDIKKHCNMSKAVTKRNKWDCYQLQWLLQCTAEHGYGNWEEVSKHFNRLIREEYSSNDRIYRTAEELKDEYLRRFIEIPALGRTWLPILNTRPAVPDRTKRIETPASNDDDVIDSQVFLKEETGFCLTSPTLKENTAKEQIKPPETENVIIYCTYCQEEINILRYRPSEDINASYDYIIIYARCTNSETCKDFYLCMTCLASGAEIGKHKNNHGYCLVSNVARYCSDDCFAGSNWNLIEELALLEGVEDWFTDDSDRYLIQSNDEELVTGWEYISDHIRSKNPLEAEAEFTKMATEGVVSKYLKTHSCIDQLVSFEQAVEMDCFKKPKRTITVTTDGVAYQEKYSWTKAQLTMLLDYTAIYGYGNWEKIATEFNNNVNYEHYGKPKEFVKKTPEEIKAEYITKFIETPIKRGLWKHRNSTRPIIADRTRLYKPVDIPLYPAFEMELFTEVKYDYYVDDYETVYLNKAESILDILFPEPTEKPISKEVDVKKSNMEKKIKENFDEDIALICLQRYNDVLKMRNTAKGLVHDYRLIEQFLVYKDKPVMPKIKPFAQQCFAERISKMALFMNVDSHSLLMVREKDEKLLTARFKELRLYRMMGITKFSEIDMFHTLRKYKGYLKQFVPLYSSAGCTPTSKYLVPACSDGKGEMKYLQYAKTDFYNSQLRGKIPLRYLANDMCEDLLSVNEKMLCLKYNVLPNDFLKTKRKIINYGVGKNAPKLDRVIYNYLVKCHKLDLSKPIPFVV